MKSCLPAPDEQLAVQKKAFAGLAVLVFAALACSADHTAPVTELKLSSITIDSGPQLLERGTHKSFTATVRDSRLQVVTVPLVWSSSNERVASFDADKRLFARDTGTTLVSAASLGITSAAVPVRVTWLGAAKLEPDNWTTPSAVTPATAVGDSIRVLVTGNDGRPVANARVIFAIAGGRGSISPAVDTTGPNGIAATQWTTGPDFGSNAATASVIGDDSIPFAWVKGNPVRFSVTTFAALKIVMGDAQSALLLASLPVAPQVRLVDASGMPRGGVPISFDVTGYGQLTSAVASTGADGVASPGIWTLGDSPGDQTLTARVESAAIVLHAMATGTAVHYSAAQVADGGSVSCALNGSGTADCWGQAFKVGDGTVTNRTRPTATSGAVHFAQLVASTTHVCGIAEGQQIYCWGLNALADTSGASVQSAAPMRLASDLQWMSVAPGANHTCAISLEETPFCWGDDSFGQLGDGGGSVRFVPRVVSGGFHFKAITSGSYHACGLTDGGAAYCWGRNQNGQLGDGSSATRLTPTATAGGLSFVSLRAGDAWTCGLTVTGSAYCWGVVPGIGVAQTTPHSYTTPRAFVSISVGAAHACALSASGEAYCWGDNSWGQLGDSTRTARIEPTPVAGGLRFSAISAGVSHTCGVTTSGEVACWGLNSVGELGDAVFGNRLTPRLLILGVTP